MAQLQRQWKRWAVSPGRPRLTYSNWELRKRDLASLAQTCRDMRQLTLPLLYGHVELEEAQAPATLAALANPANPGIRAIKDITVLPRIMPSCHGNKSDFSALVQFLFGSIGADQLRSFRVLGGKCAQVLPLDFIKHVLQTQHNLQVFNVWYDLVGLSGRNAADATSLTSLEITLNMFRWRQSIDTIARSMILGPANLQHLTIHVDSQPLIPWSPRLYPTPSNTPALRLKSLTLDMEFDDPNVIGKELAEAIDFSFLETLTLYACFPLTSLPFLSIVARHQANYPRLKELCISVEERISLKHTCMSLSTFPKLERLVLNDVRTGRSEYTDAVKTLGACLGNSTHRICMIRTLCFQPWDCGLQSLSVPGVFANWDRLLRSMPLLEELWIGFPHLGRTKRHYNEVMEEFINALAHAPNLRLLCNTRLGPGHQPHLSIDDKITFHDYDGWLHKYAYSVFEKAASRNKKFKIFALGYVNGICHNPYGSLSTHPGSLRVFVCRTKLVATGRLTAVVEEISPRELFIEEEFYRWSGLREDLYERRYGPSWDFPSRMDI